MLATFTGNYGTPWAQVFIINSFKRMGGVLGSNATCLENQLDVVAKQTDDFINQSRCDLSRKVNKGYVWTRIHLFLSKLTLYLFSADL